MSLLRVKKNLLGLNEIFQSKDKIGCWSPVYQTNGVVPAGAANAKNGEIFVWSSSRKSTFLVPFGYEPKTYTAIFNPEKKEFRERLVHETKHDMFCPGTANLKDGSIMITGGSNSSRTTVFNPNQNSFESGPDMNIPRGYHSMVTLANGDVFTLGGSWNGGLGDKLGEVWSSRSGWKVLPGIDPALTICNGTNDVQGVFRNDNHCWIFQAPNGKIFHAGPGAEMHWFDIIDEGSYLSAGSRLDDDYAMNGNCCMYDVGMLFKSGGSTRYGTDPPHKEKSHKASKACYIIDISSEQVIVERVANMHAHRTLHNSVVLPNGEIVVVGGLPTARLFSDRNANLCAEIWSPKTKSWSKTAAMGVPRPYHSVAILMKDGAVFVGGGGLSPNPTPSDDWNACHATHADAQIFYPPYLFEGNERASRPVIVSHPQEVEPEHRYEIEAMQIIKFAVLMRFSSATHSINNEQRRVPLDLKKITKSSYAIQIPNLNRAPPGLYYLFVINDKGTPSIGYELLLKA